MPKKRKSNSSRRPRSRDEKRHEEPALEHDEYYNTDSDEESLVGGIETTHARSRRWAEHFEDTFRESRINEVEYERKTELWGAVDAAGADIYSSDGQSSDEEGDIASILKKRRSKRYYDHNTLARRLRSLVRSPPAKRSSINISQRLGNFLRTGSLSDKQKVGDGTPLNFRRGVIQAIRRRFTYYDKDRDGALTRDELGRMIFDVFGKDGMNKRIEADIQLLIAYMDSDRSGKISYAEFVSFMSLSERALCKVTLKLRTRLRKLSRSKAYADVFDLASSAFSGTLPGKPVKALDAAKIAGFAAQLLDGLELTHGEANHVVALMDIDSNGLATFKDFSAFMRMKASEAKSALRRRRRQMGGNISTVAVVKGRDVEEKVRRAGYSTIRPLLGGGVSLWVKRCNGASKDSSFEEKMADSDDSDDDGGIFQSATGTQLQVITGVVLSRSNKSAGLVADGYKCNRTPLNGSVVNAARRVYLWTRATSPREIQQSRGDIVFKDRDDAGKDDAITAFAITRGKSANGLSSLWTPPHRGFKCLEQNIGKGILGSDALFLWYRKRDTLYTRESLGKRIGFHIEEKKGVMVKELTRGVASGTTLMEAIEDRVRKQLRMRSVTRKGNRDSPETLYKKLAGSKGFLRYRGFVKLMRLLGVRLPRSEMKALFRKQDYDRNGKLRFSEFMQFYSLYEGEVDDIVQKLRERLQRVQFDNNVDLKHMFRDMDPNRDGQISTKQLKRALRSAGIRLTRDEIERIIDRFDPAESGEIDYENFVRFMSVDAERYSESAHRKNIRAAARALHAYIRREALKGENSGRLAIRPDWGRAWRKMHGLGKGSIVNKYIASKRYRRKGKFLTQDDFEVVLRSLAIRLEHEELWALMVAIDDRKQNESEDAQCLVSYEAFVRFGSMQRKREVKKIRGVKKYLSKPQNERKDRLFHNVKAALIAELRQMAFQNKNVRGKPNFRIPFALFHSHGRDDRITEISVSEFVDHLNDLRAASPLNLHQTRRLIRQIDADGDGIITLDEFTRFLQSGDSEQWHPISTSEVQRKDKTSRENRAIQLASTSPGRILGGEEAFDTWWLSLDVGQGENADVTYTFSSDEEGGGEDQECQVKRQWQNYTRALESHAALSLPSERGIGTSQKKRKQIGAVNLSLIDAAVESAVRRNRGHALGLLRRFQKYDKSRSGYVTPKTFHSVLQSARIYIPESEKRQLAAALLQESPEGKNCVDYIMFCDVASKGERDASGVAGIAQRIKEALQDKDFVGAFQMFDEKGDGRISKRDFARALDSMNVFIAASDLKVAFSWLRENDGKLLYEKLYDVIANGDFANVRAYQYDEPALWGHDSRSLAMDPQSVAERKLLAALNEDTFATTNPVHSVEDTLDDIEDAFEEEDIHGQGFVPEKVFCSTIRKYFPNTIFPEQYLQILVASYKHTSRRSDDVRYTVLLEAMRRRINVNTTSIMNRMRQGMRKAANAGVIIRDLFERVDRLNTGHVSRRDMREIIVEKLGISLRTDELMWLFDEYDPGRKSMVDYERVIDSLDSGMRLRNGSTKAESLHVQDLEQRFREALEAKIFSDPYFDIRKAFGGSDCVSMNDFRRGIAFLDLMLTDDEVAILSNALWSNEGASIDTLRMRDLYREEDDLDVVAEKWVLREVSFIFCLFLLPTARCAIYLISKNVSSCDP